MAVITSYGVASLVQQIPFLGFEDQRIRTLYHLYNLTQFSPSNPTRLSLTGHDCYLLFYFVLCKYILYIGYYTSSESQSWF